jgi:hypothetical protein
MIVVAESGGPDCGAWGAGCGLGPGSVPPGGMPAADLSMTAVLSDAGGASARNSPPGRAPAALGLVAASGTAGAGGGPVRGTVRGAGGLLPLPDGPDRSPELGALTELGILPEFGWGPTGIAWVTAAEGSGGPAGAD